jgi:molecular chaperone DnaK
MIVGGLFHKLIEQNTTVPTSASHIFTTVRDNQTSVKILVLQGESDKATDNELLGEFILSGLRKAPKGEVEVEVTFSISADGLVSVAAKDLETGREQSITVTATSGLTEDELQKLVDSSQNYMVEVRASEEFERQRQQAEKLIAEVRELFPQVEGIMSGTSFGRDAIAKAEGVLERAEGEIRSRDSRSLEEVIESLERTLNMFRGVVSKTGLS